MSSGLAAVVLAGGLGTRMRSATPKHLHALLGRRMVDWVILAAQEAGADRLVVVTSPETSDAFEGLEVAVQREPLGTGDAVRSARAMLEGVGGAVLAAAAAFLRDWINDAHMLAGVTIIDPATTWIEPTVELESDTVVHPFTILRGSTRVETGAEVGPHVVAVDALIGPGATVGPFTYVRPGTRLGTGAKAGAFVEIKNSTVGEGAKVPHLSYIGDAEIGEGTNIGAGAITVNFPHQPGREKGRTKIGRNVRTGVQNAFVAPVEIGDDAWIAVGSVVTEDVPPGSLAGFAPRQVTKEGYVYEKYGEQSDD